MSSVYLNPRAEWLSWLLQTNKVQFYRDREQTLSIAGQHIAIDMMQSNSFASVDEVIEYSNDFDRVILIDHEPKINIPFELTKFDCPNVTLISSAKIISAATNIKVINTPSSFFATIAGIHRNIEHCQNFHQTIKPLLVDALLGWPKSHRKFVYELLAQHPEVSAFIRMQHTDNAEHSTFFLDSDITTELDLKNFYSGGLVKYNGADITASCFLPIEIYNQTAYTIVTESFTNPNLIWFTEKTAKPLMAKRLFVMFAGPGYLQELHKLGFKTFSHVIDESYDQEQDDVKRWTMAFEQIKKLSAMSQQDVFNSIQPQVDHNQRILLETAWEENFNQTLLNEIYE